MLFVSDLNFNAVIPSNDNNFLIWLNVRIEWFRYVKLLFEVSKQIYIFTNHV